MNEILLIWEHVKTYGGVVRVSIDSYNVTIAPNAITFN